LIGLVSAALSGLGIVLGTFNPGRRSPTRFALGYYLSGFQPYGIAKPAKIRFTQFMATLNK
jgi:hypothetical protein